MEGLPRGDSGYWRDWVMARVMARVRVRFALVLSLVFEVQRNHVWVRVRVRRSLRVRVSCDRRR